MKTTAHFRIADPIQENLDKGYYDLRWRVLRQPWGQPRGTERDEQEEQALHRAVVSPEGEIVACGRLQLLSREEAQIRYMAVHPDFRGRGLGLMVISELEMLAFDAGIERLLLQARDNAVPFYQRAGYRILQPTFLLYDVIQHFLMEKKHQL